MRLTSRLAWLLLVLPACGPIVISSDSALDDGGAVRDTPDAYVDEGSPRAIFVVPRDGVEEAFFDLPWPSDLLRTSAGTPDLTGFPNPSGIALLDDYAAAIERDQHGYSTNGAVYLRLSRAVD
jgi:hypothetical protein